MDDLSIYENFVGKTVRVKVCENSEFKGTSAAVDAYLNVSLESAIYYENNQKPKRYSLLFIKGSYIDHIALDT